MADDDPLENPWAIYGREDLLSELNLYTQKILHKQGWKDYQLYASIDSREDAVELVSSLLPKQASDPSKSSMANDLWDWHKRYGKRSGHNQLNRVLDNWETRERVRKQSKQPQAQSSSYAIQKYCNPRPVRFRSAMGAKIAGVQDEQQRANMLRNQRERWLLKLVEILRRAQAPICAIAMRTSDPMATLKLAFGTLRFRTLRHRYKTWSKVSLWLNCIHQLDWPSGPEQLLDYLGDVGKDMARTFPNDVAAALAVLEKAGGWAPDKKISELAVWKNAVQAYTAEKLAEQGNPSVKKAMQPFVSMIISWELTVGAEAEPFFRRLWAFIRLLKTWASLRADDVQGICHKRLSLGEKSLRGIIMQTKTTGPGKKIRELVFFVSRRCRFVQTTDWLTVGVELLGGIKLERDFLLPRPSSDLRSTTMAMMVYSDMAAVSRDLSLHLSLPVWKDGRWREGDQQLLPAPGHLFHTGHSERHFVVSVAAAIGIPKEDRDMCGRWGVLQSQSHDYVHTSKEVTLRVQNRVFSSLQLEAQYDEEDLCHAYKYFLGQKGLESEEAKARCKVPCIDYINKISPERQIEEIGEEVDLDDIMNEVDAEPLNPVGGTREEVEPQLGQYWVTISKSGFRRLHQAGKERCQVKPSQVHRWEICTDQSIKADKACAWCFGRLESAGEGSSSGSSDSELDSSDDEGDKLVDWEDDFTQ